MTHEATIARELVTDPDNYHKYRHQYQSELEYYRQVRNKAPQSLSTFAEFRELHEVFIEQSTTNRIVDWVEENLARSIKNMVTGGSPRGRAYPVETLSQLQDRLHEYQTLGIDTPSMLFVVETILEDCHDSETDSWTNADAIVESLLASTPRFRGIGTTVDLLGRVRAALALATDEAVTMAASPEEALEIAARQYRASIDRPSSNQQLSADGCLRAASGMENTVENTEKRRLLATAVYDEPACHEAFLQLLYHSARATIEAYRHGPSNPTRGRLLAAQLQLAVVDEHLPLVDLSGELDQMNQRVTAYRHASKGILYSQGRFNTTMENWPTTDFERAADEYGRAADALALVNKDREIKYRSKQYRFRAHASDSLADQYQIHGQAIEWLLEQLPADARDTHALLEDRLRHHHLRRLEYEIKTEFYNREYDTVIDLYTAYHALRQQIPVTVSTREVVEAYYLLAQAERDLIEQDYESVAYLYQKFADLDLRTAGVSTGKLRRQMLAPRIGRAFMNAATLRDEIAEHH